MTHTIAVGHVKRHGNGGLRMAVGTVAFIGDAGSFAITLGESGSVQMRNIVACMVSNLGSEAAMASAKGSSDGYVAVKVQRLGTLVAAGHANGTLDLQFVAFGYPGSLPS